MTSELLHPSGGEQDTCKNNEIQTKGIDLELSLMTDLIAVKNQKVLSEECSVSTESIILFVVLSGLGPV